MSHILNSDKRVAEATDSYYDDIIVDTGKVPAEHVVAVFNSFGLETKPPVKINGGRVLGLAVREINGELRWTRDGKVPHLPDQLSRRKLFS